jgi:hypothetical protein
MIQKVEHPTHPLTTFLSGLSQAEQLQVTLTHPFFTGHCPSCRHPFEQVDQPLDAWDCPTCGWLDSSVR